MDMKTGKKTDKNVESKCQPDTIMDGRSHGDGDDWKRTIISLTRKKSGKASVIREKIINFVI